MIGMKDWNSVRVTTLVDNDVWKGGLTSSWGLSLYVELSREEERHIILMDTSGSFDALFNNASKLGVNLSDVETIFVSHWHGDHGGCLSHVLPLSGRSTPIYVPSENSSGIRRIMAAGGAAIVCSDPAELMEGVMSTGEIGGWISEHSLMVNVKNKGLVFLTGCAHPGIVNTVKRAQQVSGISKVCAVIGGFHISGTREGLDVARFLQEIDVRLVSPCHCTGVNAKMAIAKIMKKRYVENGSGQIFSIDQV